MQNLFNLIRPEILDQAKQLDQLTHVVKSALPRNFWPHIAVAGINNQELILICQSPAWATRLRLHTRDILHMLQQHTACAATSIRIRQSKNAALFTAASPPNQTRRYLSHKAAGLIRQTAESIDDTQLKQALQKLSRNKQPSGQTE
jgi:hypothetical protein